MVKPFYLLDTNIISEVFKPKPNENIVRMIHKNEKFCAIPSTVWNELLYGVNIMAEGKKKQALFEDLVNDIQAKYGVIHYDNHAAWIHADIRSRLKEKGRSIEFPDSQIASIAVSNCMILVTRNTKHFEPIQEVSPLMMENWFEE
ncbi:MAG: type II toxin-antitoxin system VapC family toxin [Treponema sp.]|nr:type II toxin-antitoxin system VapC family toxin [Treponema sp.]